LRNDAGFFHIQGDSMSFLIQDAWAQGAPPQGDGLMSLLMMVVLFVVFYFLLIRPQTKRAKEHREMVTTLAKGDEVVTNGGVLGRITQVGENFVMVEIAQDIEVRVQKQSIAAVMPKGTWKGPL